MGHPLLSRAAASSMLRRMRWTVAGGVGMARGRGFFAELQYQSQLAAKRQAQAERAQARAYAAAVRQAERAQREAERAAAAAARARAAEQKAAEREAKRLREESRLAEVEALNSRLAETADELES